MLKIKNLHYSYGTVKALDDVSLEISEGELVSLVGVNGAGKTTLIKCIIGLLEPDSGTITISNQNVKDNPISFKRMIGYVPEVPFIYKYLTGREYLEFIAYVYKLDNAEKNVKIDYFLNLLNLSDKQNNLIETYSYGMIKKISIIGALLSSPELLILDEPLIGLDPESSYKFKQKLATFKNEGHSILFSSHILEVVEKISDRIVIIHKGKIIASGDLDSLKNKAKKEGNLEEIFLNIKNNVS